MYIQFDLPQDESYTYYLTTVKLNIIDWASQHHIPYNQKTVKYVHRVTFDDDRNYSFFAMTWAPQPPTPFKIIDTKP